MEALTEIISDFFNSIGQQRPKPAKPHAYTRPLRSESGQMSKSSS
jgi:hypothetical protein